jgi:hypothetical protein
VQRIGLLFMRYLLLVSISLSIEWTRQRSTVEMRVERVAMTPTSRMWYVHS